MSTNRNSLLYRKKNARARFPPAAKIIQIYSAIVQWTQITNDRGTIPRVLLLLHYIGVAARGPYIMVVILQLCNALARPESKTYRVRGCSTTFSAVVLARRARNNLNNILAGSARITRTL